MVAGAPNDSEGALVPKEGADDKELLVPPNPPKVGNVGSVGNAAVVVVVAAGVPKPPNEMEDAEGVPKPPKLGAAAAVVALLGAPNAGAEEVNPRPPNAGAAAVVVAPDEPKLKAGKADVEVVVEGAPNENPDPPVDPAPKLNPKEGHVVA